MEGRFIHKFRGGWYCLLLHTYQYTSTTTSNSNDPRFIQYIYHYSHASKLFVEVYYLVLTWLYPDSFNAEKFSIILHCLLIFSKINLFEKIFQEYYQSSEQIGPELVACQLYLVIHEDFNGSENLKIHYKCRYK